jgi:hypothetical protein
MARISTYVIDTAVTLLDRWIGTDSGGGNATKNFTAQSVADLFNENGSVAILGQNNFKFQTDGVGGRQAGTISFDGFGGDGTSFSSITTIKISKYAVSQNLMLDYLETLVGQYTMIAQLDNLNNFGIYKLESLVQDIDEPNFYDITLTLEESHGALESEKYYGLAIYPGTGEDVGDKNYVHNQSVASQTWTVNHNLGKYASATMVLSTGQKGYGDITYIDENTLTITFASAESGKAYIN